MGDPLRQVALISDIHGNFISLQAVLADIARHSIDEIVCLGDTAANGPQPAECLALLEEIGPRVVMGNADEWLLHPTLAPDLDDFHRKVEESDLWTIDQLSPANLRYLRTFQPSHLLDTPTPLLAFHATPRSNREIVLPTTPVEEAAAIFADFPAPLLAGGHTHQPFVRRIHHQTFINPGSVGLPYFIDREDTAHNPPWAEYALLRWGDDDSLGIELRRVPVDTQAIHRAYAQSGMPHADFWAADW
ncbi:MAG: metallophosphoesterase family protein [Caldilineaceae bacterium]